MIYHCDNCGVQRGKLNPVEDLNERLQPGDIVPSGQCKCGAFAFDEHLNAKADRMLRADEMYIALQTIINDCNEVLNGGDLSGMNDQELFSCLKTTCGNAIKNLQHP
jgi:hypothetical protein